jgi:diaminopimelate epimerase
MKDVNEINERNMSAPAVPDPVEVQHGGVTDKAYVLNTGSPHYVTFRDSVEAVDIVPEARKIRNSPEFQKEGINVNFVQLISPGSIKVRTYERGVEDETYSCGTGVVASALASFYTSEEKKPGSHTIQVSTKGGQLEVDFEYLGQSEFRGIWLRGPAERVFEGKVDY